MLTRNLHRWSQTKNKKEGGGVKKKFLVETIGKNRVTVLQ